MVHSCCCNVALRLTFGFKNAAPLATASRGAGPSYGNPSPTKT